MYISLVVSWLEIEVLCSVEVRRVDGRGVRGGGNWEGVMNVLVKVRGTG